jgi:hypothetical protein
MSKKKQLSRKEMRAGSTDIFYNTYAHYALLVILTILLYGWTSSFQFSLDDDYILSYLLKIDNSLSGLAKIFNLWFANSDYRPVTMVSFWLERILFGEIAPATAHFINVLLFAILLTRIYQLVIVSKFYEDEKILRLLAFLTALIFLVHPNHVSVVANIKSRDNLLSMFFGAIAAIQFIKLYDFKQYGRVFLFIFFNTLALLSKRDAYSFILYPPLLIMLFREVNRRQLFKVAAAIFGLSILSILIIGRMSSNLVARTETYTQGFNENPLFQSHTFTQQLSLSLTTLFYYIKFLFVPTGYYFYFGYNQIELLPLFSLVNIISVLLLGGCFALSIYFFKRNRLYLFCFLFFGIAIAYASNLKIVVAGIVMDRYNFIPSLAFCIAVAAIFIDVAPKKNLSIFKNAALAATVVIFAGFTVYRTSAWKNSFTLFDRDLPHLTKSVHANRIAGGTYIHLALQEEMKKQYDRSFTDSFITKGERYATIALQNSDKAPQVWELLGLVDLYHKNDSTALNKFKMCYAIDTSYLSGINYIGFTYWNLGNIDSAAYYFNYVMTREPYFNYAANNMINMLNKNNRKKEADSIIAVLYKRYPTDVRLQDKIKEVSNNNSVLFNKP